MDKLCTIKEIAAWLGVSHHVVAGWIRDRGLYVRQRVGRRVYLCKSDVTKFLERENFLAEQRDTEKNRRLKC